MGLWGPKVDSIDYLRDKSQELTPELEKEQRRTRQDLEKDAAFVIFKDRREATEAAQACFGNKWFTLGTLIECYRFMTKLPLR